MCKHLLLSTNYARLQEDTPQAGRECLPWRGEVSRYSPPFRFGPSSVNLLLDLRQQVKNVGTGTTAAGLQSTCPPTVHVTWSKLLLSLTLIFPSVK